MTVAEPSLRQTSVEITVRGGGFVGRDCISVNARLNAACKQTSDFVC